MSLFFKKTSLFKIVSVALLCFTTMPTYGMMGRLRIVFQKGRQAVAQAIYKAKGYEGLNLSVLSSEIIIQKKQAHYALAYSCAGFSFFATQKEQDDRHFQNAQESLVLLIKYLAWNHSTRLLSDDFNFFKSLKTELQIKLFLETFPNRADPDYKHKYLANIDRLFFSALYYLSDKQLLAFMEAFISLPGVKINQWMAEYAYHGPIAERVVSIGLEYGSTELKEQIFYELLPYMNNLDFKKKWMTVLGIYNSFEKTDIEGPLFCGYEEKYSYNLSLKLKAPYSCPNFDAILPDIADYVGKEYAEDRIVFFHGQSSIWIFLENFYRAFYELKHNVKLNPNFMHIRFQEHSTLSQEELTSPDLVWVRGSKLLLFVNLIPNAGEKGRNSLDYAMKNWDQTTKENAEAQIQEKLEMIIINLGLVSEFLKLQEENPHLLRELKELFKSAFKEQGNHGRLLVISMPKNLASAIAYSARWNGSRKELLKKDPTTNPVTISKQYDQVPYENQFALKLTEEVINPDAAAAAGVKIIGFDPCAYWRTEKYLKFEEKLKEVVARIKKIQNQAILEKQRLSLHQEIVENERLFL